MSKSKNRKKNVFKYWIHNLPLVYLSPLILLIWLLGWAIRTDPVVNRDSLISVSGHFVDDAILDGGSYPINGHAVSYSYYLICLDDGNCYGVYCGLGGFWGRDKFREKDSHDKITLWVEPELSTISGTSFYKTYEIQEGDTLLYSLDRQNTEGLIDSWILRIFSSFGALFFCGLIFNDLRITYVGYCDGFHNGKTRRKRKNKEKERREKKEKHMKTEGLHSENKK